MNQMLLFALDSQDWNEAGRATLRDFIRLVANTPLKIKTLSLFLYDPYLCLSSEELAHRLGVSPLDVRNCARELYASRTFHYCESFAYSDLCSLSFPRHSPAVQHCLGLLRLGLQLEPEFVWAQVDSDGLCPYPTPFNC